MVDGLLCFTLHKIEKSHNVINHLYFKLSVQGRQERVKICHMAAPLLLLLSLWLFPSCRVAGRAEPLLLHDANAIGDTALVASCMPCEMKRHIRQRGSNKLMP